MVSRRPLTKLMQECLLDCYEKELSGLEPCHPFLTKFSKGLIARGMLELRPYSAEDGKIKPRFYVTDLGKKTLELLNMKNS